MILLAFQQFHSFTHRVSALRGRVARFWGLRIVRDEQRHFLGAVTPMLRAGTVDAYWYAAIALDTAYLRTLASSVPLDFALAERQPSRQRGRAVG